MIRVTVDAGPIISGSPSVIVQFPSEVAIPDLPLGRRVEIGQAGQHPAAGSTPLHESGLPEELMLVLSRLSEGGAFWVTSNLLSRAVYLSFWVDNSQDLLSMNYYNVQFVIGVLAASGWFEVTPA